jgi:hypothetical protein
MEGKSMSETITRTKLWGTDESFAAWLNEYSAKGWQLSWAGFVRYRFTKGAPGEYVYRYHCVAGPYGSPERADYLRLLAGMGAEVVRVFEDPARRQGYAILRRPAALGDFELESDVTSQMSYTRRLGRHYIVALAVCAVCAVGLLTATGFAVASFVAQGYVFGPDLEAWPLRVGTVFGWVCLIGFIVYFCVAGWQAGVALARVRRRVAQLRQESLLHE